MEPCACVWQRVCSWQREASPASPAFPLPPLSPCCPWLPFALLSLQAFHYSLFVAVSTVLHPPLSTVSPSRLRLRLRLLHSWRSSSPVALVKFLSTSRIRDELGEVIPSACQRSHCCGTPHTRATPLANRLCVLGACCGLCGNISSSSSFRSSCSC